MKTVGVIFVQCALFMHKLINKLLVDVKNTDTTFPEIPNLAL